MKYVLALLLSLACLPAFAQGYPKVYLSAASLNPTLVFAAKGEVTDGVAVNSTSTIYYLKLYDKATAPTCGTDVPVATIPVLGTQSVRVPASLFVNGIGFCLTGAIANNDTTNAATGVAVNLSVSGGVH